MWTAENLALSYVSGTMASGIAVGYARVCADQLSVWHDACSQDVVLTLRLQSRRTKPEPWGEYPGLQSVMVFGRGHRSRLIGPGTAVRVDHFVVTSGQPDPNVEVAAPLLTRSYRVRVPIGPLRRNDPRGRGAVAQ